MGIRQWIRRWLRDDRRGRTQEAPALVGAGMMDEVEMIQQRGTRITVAPAVNGKIVVLGIHKPNPHGPDWTFQNYVVPEGADIMETIKVALTVGALTK